MGSLRRPFVAVLACLVFGLSSVGLAGEKGGLPYGERLSHYLEQIRNQGVVRFWWKTRPQKIEPARNRAISIRVSEIFEKLLAASYTSAGDAQILLGPPLAGATPEARLLMSLAEGGETTLPSYINSEFIAQLAEDQIVQDTLSGVFGRSLPVQLAPALVAELIHLYEALSEERPAMARIRIAAKFATSQFWNTLIPQLGDELTFVVQQAMFDSRDALAWLSVMTEIDYIASKNARKPDFKLNVRLTNKLKEKMNKYSAQLQKLPPQECVHLIGTEEKKDWP